MVVANALQLFVLRGKIFCGKRRKSPMLRARAKSESQLFGKLEVLLWPGKY